MKQKIAVYLFLLVFNISKLYAQLNTQLCKVNEVIVFAFQLKNKKWVSICQEKNEKHIVYRSGTSVKTDLQFPSVLDTTSWDKFSFKGYNRGGGKQNDAMNFAYLNFTNNTILYEVYESWSSYDDKADCGVLVVAAGKIINSSGILKTRKGYLPELCTNDKMAQQE